MDAHVRQPIAAGSFYPANPDALSRLVHSALGDLSGLPAEKLRHPLGLIAPHAGYLYSGDVAAQGYAAAAAFGKPDLAVVLGANHTGLGTTIALPGPAPWRTPLGDLPVDTDLIRRWSSEGLAVYPGAFLREHSIEVQLPFMQTLWPDGFRLAPVCVQFGPLTDLKAAAEILAPSLAGQSLLVVVSTDFTHYEPDATARALDQEAIERILERDAGAFHQHVQQHRLSICGAGAITLLLLLSGMLEWTHATCVAYATSGDTTGDRSAVVGYAAALLRGGSND